MRKQQPVFTSRYIVKAETTRIIGHAECNQGGILFGKHRNGYIGHRSFCKGIIYQAFNGAISLCNGL